MTLNELWFCVLEGLGYTTGTLNERQMEAWGDQGYTGTWNERAFQFWSAGGTFGPAVRIVDNDNPAICGFQPPTTTDCTASGTYTAIDTGFAGTVIQWLWTIESGDALITAGQDTDTVTVQTGAAAPSDTDIPFVLKVIANSIIAFDVAETEKPFTQLHTDTNVMPAYIGPDVSEQFVAQGELLIPIDTFNLYTGTNLVFSLEGAWPAAIVIDSGTGIITGTATDPVASYPNLTVRATNSKGFDDSTAFTVTITLNEVAPVFDAGPVPAQVWQVGVPIAQLAMNGFFSGTLPITYTIESGALPDGITMAAAGQINGTPTTDVPLTGSLVVRATNGAGTDVTNNWGWTSWEAIAASAVPDQSFPLDELYTHDFSQYFTGTITSWALGGTWPAGFAIDGNGVVTGTATVDQEAFPGLFITADNIYETPVSTTTFNGLTEPAVAEPVFYALTPDDTTFEMLGVKIGTGDLTTTHTADLYAQDVNGLYRLFAANEPVWSGGRLVVNLVDNEKSPSLTNCTITNTGLSDPDGGANAFEVTTTGAANCRITFSQSPPAATPVRASVSLRLVSGDSTGIDLNLVYGISVFPLDVVLTSSWQRFSPESFTTVVGNDRFGFSNCPTGCVIEVYFHGIEQVYIDETKTVDIPLVNPGFATDTDWTKGTGWTISAGEAHCDGTQAGNTNLTQTASSTSIQGLPYRVTFDVTAISAGTVKGTWSGSIYGGSTDAVTTAGRHSFLFVRNGAGSVRVQGSSDFVGSIDNVVFERVDQYGAGPAETVYTAGDAPKTKVFANENGNTVLANVVTEAVGAPLSEIPYLQYYPAAQNECLYSNDQSNAGVWILDSMTQPTQDQVGITGEANTACFMEDVQAAQTSACRQQVTITNGVDSLYKVWFKKDNDQTRFVSLFTVIGGQNTICQLNTETGAFNVRSGTANVEVIDAGDWWILIMVPDDQAAAVTFRIRPADSTIWGSGETTAQGSCIVGQVEIHENKTIAEVRGLGPIVTTTAAVATDQTVYDFDFANHDGLKAAYYFDLTGDGDLTGEGGGNSFLYWSSNNRLSSIASNNNLFLRANSTNIIQYIGSLDFTVENVNKIGAVWSDSDSDASLNVNGVYSTEYNLFTSVTGSVFRLQENASVYPWNMRELQRFDITTYQEGKDIINDLMAETITMTAGNSGQDVGYEAGQHGTLAPDDPFGFTITMIEERFNDVTIIVDGIQVQTIFDTMEIDGVVLDFALADTFGTGGGVSTWTFDATALTLVSTTVYPVKVKTA